MLSETPSEKEQTYNYPVLNEYSDLVHLYEIPELNKEQIETALKEHYTKYGRVGFNQDYSSESVDALYSHFTKNSKKYLSSELQFIKNLESTDMSKNIEAGLVRAKSVFSQTFKEDPQLVLLLNGDFTDAKVLKAKNQFGVNLQNLFSKIYDPDSNSYDMEMALGIIESNCAHEGNHVYVKALENTWEYSKNWIVDVCFIEGLATFVETQHHPWHEEYLKDNAFWKNTVSKAISATTDRERVEVLRDIESNETLEKRNPKAIKSIREFLSEDKPFDRDEYENVLRETLLKRNGPIYHLGYGLWQEIFEEHGIDGVKIITSKGPKAFAQFLLAEK